MDTIDRTVLGAQLVSTWAMVGLIWFVQVVHYPLFARVGAEGFAAYEAAHRWRTTVVVGPPMVLEVLAALWLVFATPPGLDAAWAWLGLGLLVVVWASTLLLQVPAHDRLSLGYDETAVLRLVRTNWIRTAGWSARGALVLGMWVALS